MLKLQCLNISKAYLQNVLGSSLRYMNEHHYWRDTFKDQVRTNLQDWLYKKVDDEFAKKSKASQYQMDAFALEFKEIGEAQVPRKK